MKKLFAVLLVSALYTQLAVASPITSTSDAALSGATINDFESLAPVSGTSIDLGGGVTVNGNNALSIINGGNSYGTSGQVLANTHHIPWTVDFVFDNIISAMGIVMGAINTPWSVSAYDISGNVIETVNYNDPCCSGFFRGVSGNGIKHVTYTSTDYVYWDDLRFVTSANNSDIPEPASIALLGMGLGLLGFSRRRRNHL